MTCAEFRAKFETMLNDRSTDPALEEHLTTCSACREYAASINDIVLRLRNIRRETMPEDLVLKIRQIPQYEGTRKEVFGWRSDVIRAALFGIPGVVLYFFAQETEPATHFAIMLGLFVAGLTAAAVSLLKRTIAGYE